MAVVGTDLARFLKVHTAYCLVSDEASPKTLELLKLPAALRSPDPDEDLEMAPFYRWGDPTIPDPNPYERGLSADDLRARYGSS